MDKSRPSRLRAWFRITLFALVLGFFSYVVVGNLRELKAFEFKLAPATFAAALGCIALGYLGVLCAWIWLAARFGLHAGFVRSGKAWFVSHLGKYVPGKAALVLVRFQFYRPDRKKQVLMASAIEYVAMLAAAAFVLLMAVVATDTVLPTPLYIATVATFAGCALLLWPRFFMAVSNTLLRLAGRQTLTQAPRHAALLLATSFYVVTASLQGLGFFLILRALGASQIGQVPLVVGAYQAAGLVGIAALFAPGGLGVREGVLYLLLGATIDKPALIVGAIVMRLATMLVEAAWAGIFTLLATRRRETNELGSSRR